jgi:hypothetical protein
MWPHQKRLDRRHSRLKEKGVKAMKLISVNVSLPKTVNHLGRKVSTGIYNEPVAGRVMVRKLSVDGDGQADLTVHGGVYKAVYVYDLENIRYWQQELGRDDLGYGHFGENFTVEGMLDDRIHIGDVFRIGGALLEVTQPRLPCFKLEMKMDLPGFSRQFITSGRLGLTPMISMLNAIVDSGKNRPAWFIHGTRHGIHHAMCRHIRRVAAENDNITVHIRYSQPRSEDVKGRDYDSTGHLSGDLLKELLPNKDMDFYLCGPPPFMN